MFIFLPNTVDIIDADFIFYAIMIIIFMIVIQYIWENMPQKLDKNSQACVGVTT